MPFLPYTLHGYIGFSACGAPSPWKEKMKHNEEDTQSQEAPSVHNCHHTPTPSCHTGARQPSQVHTHTRFHICSTARALVFPKSTHNRHPRPHTPSCQVINCTSTAHTGQERREPTWDRRLEIGLLLHTQNLYQTFPARGTCNAMPKPPRQHTGINSTPSPAAAQGSDYTDVQPPPGPGLLGAQHSSAIESKTSSLTRD